MILHKRPRDNRVSVSDEVFQYSLDQRFICCCTANHHVSSDTIVCFVIVSMPLAAGTMCICCGLLILAHEQYLAKFPNWSGKSPIMTGRSAFSLVSLCRTFGSLGKANFQVSCSLQQFTIQCSLLLPS